MTLSLTVRRWKALCRKSLQLRAVLAQSRALLDDANTITAYAQYMSRFFQKSELTERRAFCKRRSNNVPVGRLDRRQTAVENWTVQHPP